MPYLDWIGKEKIINYHKDIPYHVLEEKYTYNKLTTSDNKIIHGDNLLALKSLLPEYEGKIKCIYIDPPYNTGNENWVYNDNVNDPKIKKWLGEVVGKEEDDLSRHDKWLCMMYPRLKLLQQLLSKDGAIFISINDDEQANLKTICDEIFGQKNFVAQFAWRTDGNFDNQAKVKVCHEYVLFYLKNIDEVGLPHGIDPTTPKNSKVYKNYIQNTLVKNGPKNPKSDIVLPVGFPCAVESLEIDVRDDQYPHYKTKAIIRDYKLTNETTVSSGWSSKDLLLKYIANGLKPIYDRKGQETTFVLSATGAIELIKKRGVNSHVVSVLDGLGSTQSMSAELKNMNIIFDYPKPIELIKYLLNFYTEEDSIVLDSFAGTGTTAHAVLSLNKNDGGNRKFIIIEMEDYAETKTAERVRQAINGYVTKTDQNILLYSEEITLKSLKNAEKLLNDANEAYEKAKITYDKVSKPKINKGMLQVTRKISKNSVVEGTGGDFTYYELGESVLLQDDTLNENLPDEKIKEYIWITETHIPYKQQEERYYLGSANNTAYYFCYEKRKMTTLDYDLLSEIKVKSDSYVIYADICALSEKELLKYNLTFKKIPRDITRL